MVELTRDLQQRDELSPNRPPATGAPRRATQLVSAARGHAERLNAAIERLDERVAAVRPQPFRQRRGRARFGLGQWRPVLVGARHRAQSGRARRRRRAWTSASLPRNPQPEQPVRAADADPRPRRRSRPSGGWPRPTATACCLGEPACCSRCSPASRIWVFRPMEKAIRPGFRRSCGARCSRPRPPTAPNPNSWPI